jgi:uncharacterized protein YjgD (DUF1641 family)
MDVELAVLNQKIDALTTLVIAQQERIQALEGSGSVNGGLHSKLDYLVAQMEIQNRQQQELLELRDDLVPIVNHMIKLSIDELAEIGSDFQLEDLLFLLKRLLRDTRMLVDLMDRMQGAAELGDEVQRMGRQMFNQATLTLDRLEQEGYFTFARGGWRIMEKIVQEFSEEDINALGENIVTILKTVRNLTQPEIMALTNQAVEAIRETPAAEGEVTVWALIKDLSDPKTRKGLARLVNVMKILADQPSSGQN